MGESIGEKRPDRPLAVLDGVDLVRHRWQDDNFMGDRASGSIPASSEARESQRYMAADVPARGCIALGSPESALVDRERVGVSPVEEEAEAPRASACSPDEVHHRLLTKRRSSTPWARSSLNCVTTAVRKSRSARAWAWISSSFDLLSLTAFASAGIAIGARIGPTFGILVRYFCGDSRARTGKQSRQRVGVVHQPSQDLERDVELAGPLDGRSARLSVIRSANPVHENIRR